jgi:regulator of protease activity HflC (stomatin/prohibitin superfamily)
MSGVFCFYCIETQDMAVIEKCGKFDRAVPGGLQVVLWPCESVSGAVSLKMQLLNVRCETKTLDNVFVTIDVAIQYMVLKDKITDAYYLLDNPHMQLRSYVFDSIRSTIPGMNLDEVFEAKDEIATAVRDALEHSMAQYGFQILQTLVNDVEPDPIVKNAMNQINTSRREKEAAEQKAEADKIILVKNAEADAEAKYLSGVGVARQRKALVDGLRDSITFFSDSVEGVGEKTVMDLLLLAQYFDMLKAIGDANATQIIFTPYASGHGIDEMVRDGQLQSSLL